MFDSGISASSLISGLKDEIDVAIPISNKSYVESLNSLEQLLYTEIIKEQKSAFCEASVTVDLSQIPVGSGEKAISFEDIYAVYDRCGTQLKKTNLASSDIFSACWYKDGNKLGSKTNIYTTLPNRKSTPLYKFTFHEMSDTSYGISGVSEKLPDTVIIPSKYNEKPVTILLSSSGFDENVKRIIVPNSVTGISGGFFDNCVNCIVEIPASVITFGADIFTLESNNIVVCEEGSQAETYCIDNNIAYYYDILSFIYFVRPTLKTVNSSDVVGSGNVMLPVEFIDLAKAKLRADAYKIANEDALAAKWIADYNVLLENFKAWMDGKRANFGF